MLRLLHSGGRLHAAASCSGFRGALQALAIYTSETDLLTQQLSSSRDFCSLPAPAASPAAGQAGAGADSAGAAALAGSWPAPARPPAASQAALAAAGEAEAGGAAPGAWGPEGRAGSGASPAAPLPAAATAADRGAATFAPPAASTDAAVPHSELAGGHRGLAAERETAGLPPVLRREEEGLMRGISGSDYDNWHLTAVVRNSDDGVEDGAEEEDGAVADEEHGSRGRIRTLPWTPELEAQIKEFWVHERGMKPRLLRTVLGQAERGVSWMRNVPYMRRRLAAWDAALKGAGLQLDANRMTAYSNRMITLDPDRTLAKIAELRHLVPTIAWDKAAARNVLLLGLRPPEVARKVDDVKAVFAKHSRDGEDAVDVDDLLSRRPGLLLSDTRKIADRVDDMLGYMGKGAVHSMLEHGVTLSSLSPEVLRLRYEALPSVYPHEQPDVIVEKFPEVLSRLTDSLKDKQRRIIELFKFSEDDLQLLLIDYPQALRYGMPALAEKWQRLHKATARRPSWSADFDRGFVGSETYLSRILNIVLANTNKFDRLPEVHKLLCEAESLAESAGEEQRELVDVVQAMAAKGSYTWLRMPPSGYANAIKRLKHTISALRGEPLEALPQRKYKPRKKSAGSDHPPPTKSADRRKPASPE